MQYEEINAFGNESLLGKKKPKVSVCVMTYNQKNYIGQCLQSIVDQKTDFEFEVIVADDCSSDGTREIVEFFAGKYPKTVKAVLHSKNVGVGINYRSAHDLAVGQYVAHCDGDDFWLPGKLSYQSKLLDLNPEVSQCWAYAYLVDDNGVNIGLFPSRLARILNPVKITARDIALSYALVGQHSTQMYRRNLKIDFDVTKPILDFWIAYNMALKGNAIYSKEIVACYRLTKSPSLTRTSSNKRATVDFLAMHLNDIIKSSSDFSVQAKSNLIARRFLSKIRGHNLSVIDEIIYDNRDQSWSFLNMLLSVYYFCIQKIK